VNGVATILASDNTAYAQDTWYQVKFGGYNGYLTLAIDGTEIFSVPDTTYTSGKAGLYCWGNQSSFWDNVVVECAVDDSVNIGNITIPSGQSECYEATQVITVGGSGSAFLVQAGGNARLVAGQKIRMLPACSVLSGGNLHAYISPDGFYCMNPSVKKATIPEDLTPGNPPRPLTANRSLLNVYPNPTAGKFTFDTGETEAMESSSVEIYDRLGRMVMSTRLSPGNLHLVDLSDQANGMYFIMVRYDNRVKMGKVVICR
jgi:hypothetical protein